MFATLLAAGLVVGCGDGTVGGAASTTDSASAPTLDTFSSEGGPITDGIPWSSPAVSTFDESDIYFNDWTVDAGTARTAGDHGGTPSIGRYNQETGQESTFAQGAVAPVVSRTGAVAYARGVHPHHEAGQPYVTDIVVKNADGSTKVWQTAPDEMTMSVPVAWANGSLLVMQIDGATGFAKSTLVRSDGQAELPGLPLAISPDGSAVLTTTDRSDPNQLLVVIDTATFAVRDTIGFEAYAEAFLPGSGEETFDRADLRPGPEGRLPVAPMTTFGTWTNTNLVLPSARGLLIFDSAPGSSDLTPHSFVPVGQDTLGVTTTIQRMAALGDGVAVSVERVNDSAISNDPPPKQLTLEQAQQIANERAQARNKATSQQVYRCDITAGTCRLDPTAEPAIRSRAHNFSR
jgi:hypothetical protein